MTRTRSIRWTASRKRELVASIFSGERTTEQALAEHQNLSIEELQSWMLAYEAGKGDAKALCQKALHASRKAVPA